MTYHDAQLQESNQDNPALAESLALMEKKGYPEDEVARFAERGERILDKLSGHFGAGTQYQYSVSRSFGRVRLRIVHQGEHYDPLSDEEDTNNNVIDYVERLFLVDRSSYVTYRRLQGRNVVTQYSAVKEIPHN